MNEQDETAQDDGPRHVVAQAGLASAAGTTGPEQQQQGEGEG